MTTAATKQRRSMSAVSMLAVLLLVAACEGPADHGDSAAVVATDGADYPEQKFYDYRLIETQAGVRQWVLDSDEMLKYPDRRDVELVRVRMDFFREGAYYSTLVSDSGTADLNTHDVFVWGHVVVTTTDGRRLRTSELSYTNEDGLIRNEVYNVFDRGEDVVTGIGLEATPDLDYIEIKQDVAAEVGDEVGEEVDQEAASGAESGGENR